MNANKIIDPFQNVPHIIIPDPEPAVNRISNLTDLQIGAGNTAVKADSSGLWAGGNRFTSAPFRVDMNGNIIASSLSFLTPQTTTLSGLGQLFTTDGLVTQISNAFVSVEVTKATHILVLFQFHGAGYKTGGSDWATRFNVRLFDDSSVIGGQVVTSHDQTGGDDQGDALGQTHFLHALTTLPIGTHVISAKGNLEQGQSTNGGYNLANFSLSVVDFGGEI